MIEPGAPPRGAARRIGEHPALLEAHHRDERRSWIAKRDDQDEAGESNLRPARKRDMPDGELALVDEGKRLFKGAAGTEFPCPGQPLWVGHVAVVARLIDIDVDLEIDMPGLAKQTANEIGSCLRHRGDEAAPATAASLALEAE